MASYNYQFLLPAQSHLNLVNPDRFSVESLNLATILLSNANISHQTFSSVMASLVSATKTRSTETGSRVILSSFKTEKDLLLLLVS